MLATSGIGTVGAQSGSECVIAGESIQAAIDAASPGETICVADGTFEEGLTITTSDLTLIAADGAQPVLNGSDLPGSHGIHVSGATGVTIDGFGIEAFEGVNGIGGIGIYLEDAHAATVRNTEIRNNDGGVFNRDGDDVTIESNVLRDNEQGEVSGFSNVHGGIHLYNASNNAIETNDASGNHETNIYVRNSGGAIVRGNTVGDAPNGQTGSIYVSESANALIENNTVTDNVGGDLRRGIGLDQAHGAEISDNDIERNQGVALHIDSSDSVSVSRNTITDNQFTGVVVTGSATNTVLEENTIELNDNHGIRILSDGVVVRDNVLSANEGTGVTVSDGQAVVVRSNRITDSGANGVGVSGSSTSARDSLVENNTISGSGGDGIWISGPRDVIVRNNNVTTSVEHGIHAIDAESVLIEKNNASGNQLSGIKTDGAVNVTVSENTVEANVESGILIIDSISDADAREMLIDNNTATNNVDGVRLEGGSLEAINIETNRLEENTNGVTIAGNPMSETAVRIQLNAIQNNADRGVNHEQNQFINITNNWWGDASGPSGGAIDRDTDAIANGTGDSIEHSDHTNRFWFDPWLTADPADDSSEPIDARFDIEITDTNEPVTAGETLVVTATVTNVGGEGGTETIELADASATVLNSSEVTLGESESETIELSWETTNDVDAFELSVASPTDSDTVTVTVTDGSEEITYSELSVSPASIYTGGSANISATVENTDSTARDYVANLTIGGTVVGNRTGTLNGGESETVTFLHQFDQVGTKTVTIEDLSAETVSVTAAWAQFGFGDNNVGSSGSFGPTPPITEEWNFTARDSADTRSIYSPVIADGTVYFGTGDAIATNKLYAINATTLDISDAERERWTVDVSGSVLGAPVVTTDRIYVATNSPEGSTVEAIDRVTQTSEEIFETEQQIKASPTVVDGVVYIGTRSQPDSSTDGALYAIDVDTGTVKWTVDLGVMIETTPAVSDGIVYIGTFDSKVYAVEVDSGDFAWDSPFEAGTAGISSSPAVANGIVHVGSNDNHVYAINASTGEAAWNQPFETGGAVRASPAVANDLVYVGSTDDKLYAITADTGVELWNTSTGGDVLSSPAVAGLTVYVGSNDNRVYAFNGFTGDELWSFETAGSVATAPAVLDGRLYVSGDDGTLHTFATNGEGLEPDPDPEPEPESELAVTNATLEPEAILKNDSVTISADIENVGEAPGTLLVALTVGDEVVDAETVELDVGETDSVEFTHTFENAGEFTVEIGGESAGNVTVIESAEVLVYGTDVDRPEQVEPGDTITVTGRLYNTAPVATDETVALKVNGTAVNETTTRVNGSSIQRVELSWIPDESDLDGDDSAAFEVTLNGFVVETVTVEYRIIDIQVIAASVSENELTAGENASITGSIYQAGNVEGPQTIYLNATKDGVTSIIGSQDVTLAPGFYHLGALNITTQFTDPGTYDLALGDRDAGTVEVAVAESDIEVVGASVSDDDVIEGEELYVVGSLYQNGTVDGPQTIKLNATDTKTGETTTLGSHDATLAPGFYHLGAVNLSVALDEPGTYEITLGDRDAGTVTVSAAVSDIQIVGASVSDDEVMEGEELYVSGSLYQNGNIDGPQAIELNATNAETGEITTLDSHDATLAPGFYHLGAVNLSVALENAGTYDLTLGDRDAGTVEVAPAYSDIEVISASASTDDVIEGEELYVVGSLYQNGTVDGPQTIELNATNAETGEITTLGSHDATLAPGWYHLGAVNLSVALEDAGTYDLTLGDRDAGTVDVAVAESDIEVISASLSAMNVTRNEELYVSGSLYQNGTIDGPQTINVTATKNGVGEVVENQSVTLRPGFYHLGGLNVSFALDESGIYTIDVGGREAGTVYVDENPSDIRVISASISDIEVLETDELYVVASIYQAGETGTEEIELTATKNGTAETTVVGSQEVTLESGFYHLGAINISFALDEPGTYDLELGGEPAGTIDVIQAKSDIEVIAASVSDDDVLEGEELYVVGSLYQNGTIDGPQTIELTATKEGEEPQVVGEQTVTLAPDFYHLGAVNISVALDEPGIYDLTLGDRDAGTVEVAPAYSDIEVISASVSDDAVIEGEEFYVVGSLYQNGTIDGPQAVELTATNTQTDEITTLGSHEAMLTPGWYHLGAVNLSVALDEPGIYDLTLGDRDAGTVTVSAAESDIDVISASASTDRVTQTEELYGVGSLYQNGTIEGPESITLTATEIGSGETIVVGTHEATLVPGWYHLGAVNISFALDEPGTYELTLGDRDAGTVEVVPPTVNPTITAVDGYSTATDPETGETLVYTDDDTTVDVRINADLDIEDVELVIESRATQFSISTPASHVGGKLWRADVPTDQIPDDGKYELSVVATDTLETPGFDTADEVLVIDREAPSMSLSIEDVTDDAATVIIESDEPLAEEPTVTAEIIAEDGTTADATVQIDTANAESTRFTGTLAAADASAIIDGGVGEYAVTTTGTDRAGNEETDEAAATVYTQFTLDDGVLEIPRSGTTIEFNLAEDVDEAIMAQELSARLSENGKSPNLEPGQTGVNFLTADLDSFIDYHLEEGTIESATISIAIDESTLGSSTIDDVEIQYYNEGSGKWEAIETGYVTGGTTSYVTADVTHFSTYGAVTVDTAAPDIVNLSPANGAEIDTDNEVSVTAEYADDQSGVDVGSVSITVNGADVTTDDQTTITSSDLEYVLTPAPDTEYTVTISVSDNGGNSVTDETTFSTFQDDSGGSPSGGSSETTVESSSSEEPTTEEPTPEEPPSESSNEESSSDDQPAATPNNELTTESQPSAESDEQSPSTSGSILVVGVVVGGVTLLVIGGLLARRP